MAKQLNVNMSFTADSSQAKRQIQELQTSLQSLVVTKKIDLGIADEINDAIKATAELSTHLQQATNIKTGNLDFSKLSASIKASGKSLNEYGQSLQSLGPQGQQAFMQLTRAVVQAEVPFRRTNALVKEFATTLANTARWQMSSTVLHGFMGALQSAYGYAQDLNESLNNIRIVTGHNADEMARFAKEANAAAQALSTTTTAYTNASLIYYQQGLSAEEVKKRADVTIKLANVSRQSAETVSNQMTAVWNNFYNGSKSLEYYADVMTALGAATASSTEEIAGGLEKFAAIADTIGLSYEYAAAALATLTSNTRQSEEVVGTALKTIFARIQGLNLGETLDDGTTLNKYSQALDSVGISIQDVNGDIKTMDVLLDEMGAKWSTLSKSQQIALAQTVAGTRQYNQLIALMANWDNGDADSFMSNVATARTSEGALSEQADIYAESWEAASNRVRAAAEGIYQKLINDEFFIDLLNNVEKVLEFVNRLVDSLGGLKGVLLTLGTVLTKVFSNQLAQGLSNAAYNVKMFINPKAAKEQATKEKQSFIDDAISRIPKNKEYVTDTEAAQQASMRSQLELQQEMLTYAEKMSAEEQARNQMLLDRNRIMQEEAVQAAQNKDATGARVDDAKYTLQTRIAAVWGEDAASAKALTRELNDEIAKIRTGAQAVATTTDAFDYFNKHTKQNKKDIEALREAIASIDTTGDKAVADLIEDFMKLDLTTDNVGNEVDELVTKIRALNGQSANNIRNNIIAHSPEEIGDVTQEVDDLIDSLMADEAATRKLKQARDEGTKSNDAAKEAIQSSTGAQRTWADVLVSSANVAMSAASAWTMFGQVVDTWSSPDISIWEKLTSTIMTLSMLLPTCVTLMGALKSITTLDTVAKIANVAATIAQTAAEKAYGAARDDSSASMKKGTKTTWKDTWAKIKDTWNTAAGKKSGYTRHKNGTYSVKGKKGLVSKAEGDAAVQNLGKGAAKSLGGMAAGVAVIAAGIAVIAGGIKWGIEQAKQAEKAVEKAKERVKELQTVLDTVKASYDELANKASAYESAKKGIEGLTKGTKEYSEAVYKANQAAMELLAVNKNLSYTIQDGMIVFDEGQVEGAVAAQQSAYIRAQATKYAGDQALMQAETDLMKRDLSRDLNSKADVGQKWANVGGAAGVGATGGAAIGAGTGAIVGHGVWSWATTGIGALIGAAIGAVGGAITAAIANAELGTAVDYESRALDTVAAAYAKDSSMFAKSDSDLAKYLKEDLKIDDDKLVESLVANKEETRDLAEKIKQNNAIIDAQNDLIASQLLSDNSVVTNSEHQDAIIDKAGDIYDRIYKEVLNSNETKQWGETGVSWASGQNDEEAKKLWTQYLTYAGLDASQYKYRRADGNDKNRVIVYYDEKEGKEKEISLETMRMAKAAYVAAHEAERKAIELTSKYLEWERNGKTDADAMLSFLSSEDFSDTTKTDFDLMKTNLKAAGSTEAYLKQMFDTSDLDAVAKDYGYASAEAFIDAFNVAIGEGNSFWDSVDFGGVTANIKGSTAEELNKLFEFINTGVMGENAEKHFTDGINAMLAGIDPEKQTEIMEKLVDIDWTKFDAGYEAVRIIQEAGGAANYTTEQIAEWVDGMNIATAALYDYAEVMKELQQMQEMAAKVESGAFITHEEYDLLVKYNAELAKYFLITSQGAMFTGDKLDFQQAVAATDLEEKRKSIDAMRTSLINAEAHMATTKNAETYLGSTNKVSSAWDSQGGKAITEEVASTKNGWAVAGNAVINTFAMLGQAAMDGISGQGWSGKSAADFYDDQWFDESNHDGGTRVVGYEGDVTDSVYQQQLDFLKAEGVDISQYATAAAAGQTDAQKVADAVNNILSSREEVNDEDYKKMQGDLLAAQLEYLNTLDADAQTRKELVEQGVIGEDAANYAAMQAHNTEKWEGLDAGEVGDYADHLMSIAGSSDQLADTMSKEAAEDVAAYTMKMNNGLAELNENLEEWSSILTASDKSSQEYAQAMKKMKKAMSDVLGVSEDFLSDDFILENMENIQKAAEGDAEAIDALAIAAGKDILINIKLEDEAIREELLALHDQLAAEIPNIEVGATLDDGDFLSKAAQIVEAAGMSVEEANAYFRSLGFEPKFETKQVPITQELKGVRTTTKVVKWGIGALAGHPEVIEQTSEEIPLGTKTEMMEVPALTTDDGSPSFSLTKTNAGSMSNTSSVNTGGGGSTPSSDFTPTKKLDIVDRYKEVNDALADTSEAADKAAKAMDRLYGSQRASQMAAVGELMKEEINLLNDKKKEIEGNLTIDQTAVNDALTAAYSAAGMTGDGFSYDANGNISNYTAVMESLFNNLSSAETAAMADGMITEAEQEHIDNLKEMIEELKAAIAQYDDTNSELADIEGQLTDKFYEWQDNNQEMLTYKLELNLEVNELELQQIEYYLDKLGNDFYSMAEAAQYLIGTATGTTLNTSGSKLATTLSNASNYQTLYNDTVSGYTTYVKTNENGELVSATQAEYEAGLAQRSISDAAYAENLKTVYSGLVENLGALNELDGTMMAYYGETVAAAVEEIDVYTERMAHHTTVLEHYNKLLGIIGEENNYKAIGVVLEGQAKTAENSLKVSTEMYETFADEAEHWQAKMAEALAEGDTAAFDLYQENWAAAEAQARESQDKMLSDLAAWAEAEKAVLENTLSDLGKTLEESLTGGLSFDKLSTQMERAQSLQEEYLTTTNQIYETTKMMRTAQQAIDVSSNTVAKEKLKNFITETKSLQEQGKLSQYELDMQKAKYDLLVAEIALEEAQNAKSTVRLQRDSEGNFGYVYTADAGAVSEAQQQFDDAENALYNKGLDGANNYAQKYNTTMQEMYDTFNQIQQDRLNGAFATEEEYNNAMAEAKEYYYQKLQDYSSLYGVAISADSNIAAEAWSTDFASMINSTDQWKQDVDEYMAGAKEAFEQWAGVVATVKETTGKDLTELASNVSTITSANTELTEKLTNDEDGVIKAMQDQLTEVGNLTTAYGEYRQSVLDTISALEQLMNTTKSSITTLTIATNTTSGDGTVGAATGGLTSSWGPEGKMMMVHENELILNSDQTNRFFDNLALMESILATIDSYALNQQLGGVLSSPSYAESGNDVLEQNVKIEASFPGVTDRSEIEEAFNNLVNKASQYANRK